MEGWAQFITSIATLLGVLGTFAITWRNNTGIATVDGKVGEIKTATDGLTSKLVASTAKASHAEGVADEKARAPGKK